jgi:glycosyltransferase involved in cell wall biosynthesis
MNILHLQNYLNLSCGVSKNIYLIIKNSSQEFKHNVICLGGDGLSRFEDIGIKPIVLKNDRSSLKNILIHFKELYNYCKGNDINVIHSHHRYFDSLSWFLKLFLPVKTVTSVQSKVYNKKILSYKADILIPCSNFIKDHLIKNFKIKEERLKVIYNSVDQSEAMITRTKAELLNELSIPKDNFIIGYFGRLDFKEKGIDILLKAFKSIYESNGSIFLLLIGNGENEKEILSFISNHQLNAKVISSKKDIYNYFQVLDLFVLPSIIDPFPLVMLESGYLKTTLIASNVDGIPEVISDNENGLLFESGNANELAKKIIKVMEDYSFAKRLAQNLYHKVTSSFLVNKTIPLYEQVYRDVIK